MREIEAIHSRLRGASHRETKWGGMTTAKFSMAVCRNLRRLSFVTLGTWASCVAALVLLAGLIITLAGAKGPGMVVFMMGGGGLVGCLTNTVAIKMLFDYWPQRFPLPYSGILPEGRERITRAIAHEISANLLDPETVLAELRERDVVGLLCKFAAGEVGKLARDRRSMQTAVQILTRNLHDIVLSEEFYRLVRNKVAESFTVPQAPSLGGGAALTVLIPTLVEGATSLVATHIQTAASDFLLHAHKDKDLLKLLSERAEKAEMKLRNPDPLLRARLQRVLDPAIKKMVEEFDFGEVVKRKLDSLSISEVRELFRRHMRKHLGWLEVWGAVFGAIGGVLLFAARFLCF